MKNEKILNKVFESIQNINDSKKTEIKSIIETHTVKDWSFKDLNVFVRKDILGLVKPVNRCTTLYWTLRGWSDQEAKIKSKSNYKVTQKKRASPFSIDFWLQKGFSLEEAEYKCNSIRPIKKEYWMERGYDENQATQKALETKLKNNKNGAEKSKNRSKEEIKAFSKRCKEYWILRGYSLEEAKNKVKEIQNLNHIDRYIKKYGEEEGKRRYEKRQKDWLKKLSEKTQEEIDDINKRKNSIKLEYYISIKECIDDLKSRRNIILFETFEEYLDYLENTLMKKNPTLKYYPVDKFIDNNISKIQKDIFEYHNIFDIKTKIEHLFDKDNTIHFLRGKISQYRKWVDEGLLRSSYEIYFYKKIKEKYPEKIIEINGLYPNSSFYFDFFIEGKYIEICPMFYENEKYKKKMLKKQKVFGCILLKSIEEIDDFIERL